MPQLKMWRTAWVAAVLCAAAVGSHAQTFTNLASFNGTNGANPNYGSLVQGLDGNYYGTTAYGGANNQGTVFKVTADGTLTTLYSFCSQPNCSDGANPWVGLTLGSDGNFYGTTVNGGSGILIGAGTVFQITPAGQLNTIHRFCGAGKECSDGASPTSGLVEGIDGNFYGTTAGGGGYYDNGTIFKIASCGTFTKLYTFGVLGIGGLPSGLMLATDGNVYGTGGAGVDPTAREVWYLKSPRRARSLPSTTFALSRTAMTAQSPLEA